MFSLAGKVVAVVGAGSGIGEAIAVGIGSMGASVVCLDLSEEHAARVADRIRSNGAEAEAGLLDIRKPDDVARSLDGIVASRGHLDGVVATPGLNVRKPILQYTPADLEAVIDVNLKGSFNVLQAAGRVMCQAGSGSIVLFASIRAQVVEPGQSVYAATKAGVVQLVRTAAAEFGGSGVRVNALAPGVIETPLTRPIKENPDWYQAYATRNALGRWGRPEELAGPAAFMISDAASYLTGSVMFVDGGWTAIDGRFQPPGMS